MRRVPVRAAAALLAATMAAACRPAASNPPPPAPAAEETTPVAAARAPKELPTILARVNDETIDRWEVETAIREIELANVHPIPSAERYQIVRTVLDRIIGHHLVAQAARARNLRVSEAEVDADIARMRTEFSSGQAFEETLASFRTSLEQLRSQRRLSLEVAQFVRATIARTVSVTNTEIEDYYRRDPERFREPETVRASHILIRRLPDATPEQRVAARARAADVLAQLRRGADFRSLAREHSEDPVSASDGGDLGPFPRGQMDPAFEAAAFALESNGLSDVVETGLGFHVIRVQEHRAARTGPLAEVRDAIKELLSLTQYVDLCMPRGGEGLIRAVTECSKVPVIKHYKGVCHVYVDERADLNMAEAIVLNAKVQRPAVCNAMETLLVHPAIAPEFLPRIAEKMFEYRVEMRADEQGRALLPNAKAAADADYFTEYNDFIMNIRFVNDVNEAIAHINHYGSAHSDAIVTADEARARQFLAEVDSAAVYWNASTRFTDGGEYGMGAEIGISTDKIGARGPMGLEELTTYKWLGFGTGQIRG